MERKCSRTSAVAAGVAALAFAFTAGVARAKPLCTQTLPAPLVTFCAGAPFLAHEVNGDFLQATTWLAQKIGPPKDSALAMPDCVGFSPTASYTASGTASLSVSSGDSTCGVGRAPVVASCISTGTAGAIDGAGVRVVNGVSTAFCRAHGGTTSQFVQMSGICCRFKP
jgi:hypothetical protein